MRQLAHGLCVLTRLGRGGQRERRSADPCRVQAHVVPESDAQNERERGTGGRRGNPGGARDPRGTRLESCASAHQKGRHAEEVRAPQRKLGQGMNHFDSKRGNDPPQRGLPLHPIAPGGLPAPDAQTAKHQHRAHQAGFGKEVQGKVVR